MSSQVQDYLRPAAATDVILDTGVSGDAYSRFQLLANGTMKHGSGAAAPVAQATGFRPVIEAVSFGATELGGSETNTSFTFVAGTIVRGAWIVVTDAESGTIDVGTQGTSNDPDGLLDGISVATLGTIMPAAVNTVGLNETYVSSMTFGALTHVIKVGADEAGEKGSVIPTPTVIAAADPVSITSSGDLNSCTGVLYLDLLVPFS